MGNWFTITTGGEIIDHPWIDRPSLEQMQEQVGGYIEPCPKHTEWHKGNTPYTTKMYDAYANEEGLMYGLPINRHATEILGYTILGDVLFHGVRSF